MNRTITEFFGRLSMISDISEKMMKLDDYVRKLEDEMRKIIAFKNELPLSMLILNDAILAVKEESKKFRKFNPAPVLEQFIPLKKICEEEEDKKVEIFNESENIKEKMNWLSSVQLWNCNSNSNTQVTELDIRKSIDDELSVNKFCENRSTGIASGSFKGLNGFPFEVIRKEEKDDLPLVAELSLRIPGIKNPRDDSTSNGHSSIPSGSQSQQQQQQINRKQRRCWSPELHRRFIEALEQLGGSQVATPKQIRDLMQVDGLTNDEVKSHLQKYRIHIRRAPNAKDSGQDHSQSGSPDGPLHFSGNSRGTSMAAGNSMEDEDDGKSESGCFRSHVHLLEHDTA